MVLVMSMPKQSMLHIAAVAGGSAFLRAFIHAAWESHKRKVSANGIPMRRNRKGVYVPGGHVPVVEAMMKWFLIIFVAPLMLAGIASMILSPFLLD